MEKEKLKPNMIEILPWQLKSNNYELKKKKTKGKYMYKCNKW